MVRMGGQDGEPCGDLAMQLCSSDLWTQVPKSSAGAVLIVVLRSELLRALSLLVPLVGAGTSQVPSELLFASSSPVPLALLALG